MGRGYVVPTEKQYRELRRAVKRYQVITYFLLIGFGTSMGALAGVVLLPLLIGPYAIWSHVKCRHLRKAMEKLTLGESIAKQARELNEFTIWLFEICSIIAVIFGIFILITGSKSRLIGLVAVLFFGFGIIVFAKMLVAKEG